MIDRGLAGELDRAARTVAGIRRLPADEADTFVAAIGRRFVVDPAVLRWWESLSCPAVQHRYEGSDGLTELGPFLQTTERIRLVVTNEDAPPWLVFEGEISQLIAMLRECRFFEFMLAPEELDWLLFETHMNTIVYARYLP